MQKQIPRVLSIQSHVTYGYAGNKAAVFPMQKLGIEVSPIYTVQLSNHTQYNHFNGSFFSATDIQNVIDGLTKNDFLAKQNAILSGYIGNLEVAKVIANTVKELKKNNHRSIYCCDPVFGDKYDEDESGHIFATKEHPDIFLEYLLPLADIITPNLFELSILSNTRVDSYSDIAKACKNLIKKTGIAVYRNGNFSHIESQKYKVQPKVSGSGDITAAMFLSYILKGLSLEDTLKAVTKCLDGIFKTTHELNTDELALIQSQEYIK